MNISDHSQYAFPFVHISKSMLYPAVVISGLHGLRNNCSIFFFNPHISHILSFCQLFSFNYRYQNILKMVRVIRFGL